MAPDSIPLNVVLFRLGEPLFKPYPCISSAFTKKSFPQPIQLAAKFPCLTSIIEERTPGAGQEITSNLLPLKI